MSEDKVEIMNYPSNSHKVRAREPEPEKKVKKVIQGGVVKKKKTFWRRMTDTLLGEDVESVGGYILHDVLVPAAKNTLSDIVSGGIEMLLFGGDTRGLRSRRDRGRGRGRSYVEYDRASYKEDRHSNRDTSVRNRARHNFDDVIVESRGEADEVLDYLADLIDRYEVASVSDLYHLVGLPSTYTDDKYGWSNISSAKPVRLRDGSYLIDLPRAMPID